MPDWLASYLFMSKTLLNLMLSLIIPFAEEMRLIGVAVNPAVRHSIVHHFEFDFFFFQRAATCQSEMTLKMKTRLLSRHVSTFFINL